MPFGGGVGKRRGACTAEYNAGRRKKAVLPFATTWVGPVGPVRSEVALSETDEPREASPRCGTWKSQALRTRVWKGGGCQGPGGEEAGGRGVSV